MLTHGYIVPLNHTNVSSKISELIDYAVNDILNIFLSKAKIKFNSASDHNNFCALMRNTIKSIDISKTETDK